jgi:hypothetical protein
MEIAHDKQSDSISVSLFIPQKVRGNALGSRGRLSFFANCDAFRVLLDWAISQVIDVAGSELSGIALNNRVLGYGETACRRPQGWTFDHS